MKTFTIILMIAIAFINIYGQSDTSVVNKANQLITNKKYNSAFKLLESYDPKNEKPNIVLLKENIALKYFVTSIMHEMFAFKDLKKNEDIMDYRGKTGSFDMHLFPIDSVLNKLIKLHPMNCNLYKGLAEYYYQTYLSYGNHWLKNKTELFNLIKKNDEKVINYNCADYSTYYVMGFISLTKKEYKKGSQFFLKSISLNKDYADSYYNLAYSYLYQNDRDSALRYAKISLKMYDDVSSKSDAAIMIGEIYLELGDSLNALKYYKTANQIEPNNYYNLKPLIYICAETNDANTLNFTKTFFNLAPDNPTIYNDLANIYYRTNKENQLAEFYKAQLPVFRDSLLITGNLNFYLAEIYLDSDKKLAKEYFLKAKELFSKIYDKNNSVFNAIEKGIKQTDE